MKAKFSFVRIDLLEVLLVLVLLVIAGAQAKPPVQPKTTNVVSKIASSTATNRYTSTVTVIPNTHLRKTNHGNVVIPQTNQHIVPAGPLPGEIPMVDPTVIDKAKPAVRSSNTVTSINPDNEPKAERSKPQRSAIHSGNAAPPHTSEQWTRP